jgi:hypothetical protein
MLSLRTLALPVVAASLALAAPARAGGTDAQRDACTNDAFKFCSADIPDEGAIESCLRRNGAHLSPACRVAMRPQSAPTEATPRVARHGRGGAKAAPPAAGGGTVAGVMDLLPSIIGGALFDDD